MLRFGKTKMTTTPDKVIT